MVDPVQILLFAVVITLTILMVIIGWQIFLILREIRKMLEKFNTIADSAVSLSANIGKSLQGFSGFSEGIKAVLNVVNIFRRKKGDNSE